MEIVSPELKSGWMIHVKAVGDMMEGLGPTSFDDGIMHTIFVGFRPLLVSHKRSFCVLSTVLITFGVCSAIKFNPQSARNIP